jgi:transposase
MARCCSQRTESGGETRPFVITLSRRYIFPRPRFEGRPLVAYRDVIRAKIVLLASTGLGNDLIASRLNLARQIVSKWRNRLFDERLADLNEDPRGGRRARFAPIVVVEVKRLACEAPLARGVPLARWFLWELQRELLTRGVVATVFK